MIKITIPEIDIAIPSSDRDTLPRNKAGLYLFYNDDKELMYVGQSKDLWNRVRGHFREASHVYEVSHNFKRIECIFVEDPLDRELYETYIINTLKPALNVEKVITYQSKRFDPKLNPIALKRDEERQKKLDRMMDDFSL